MTIGLGEPNI